MRCSNTLGQQFQNCSVYQRSLNIWAEGKSWPLCAWVWYLFLIVYLFHRALTQAHGIFFPYDLTAAYKCVFACSTSDPTFICFVAKDQQQLELSDISDILSPHFNVWKVLLCITRNFQQPNITDALIHCISGSLPRTGSKILWRDFQLGKRKATWCSKSFKTLHPWTASATPHCRISQSFPRCAEWVVSFLSLLKKLIPVQRSASLPRNKLNNNKMSSPEKRWA